MAAQSSTTPTWKQFNRPWYAKLGLAIWGYIKNVFLMIWSVLKAIPKKLKSLGLSIAHGFQGLWFRFKNGDWRTKVSYLIMGFGCFSRGSKQIMKGLLLFLVEAVFIAYMIFVGGSNIARFGSLGDNALKPNPSGLGQVVDDDSLKILIFSVLTFILMIFFVYVWVKNTKIAYETQKRVEAGKELSTPKQQINYALNDGYHVTVLALPIIGVLIVSVVPLIVNILVAFTNYNFFHQPPGSLIDWTGFSAFKNVFGQSYGEAIWKVLGWTLIWAVFATFTNFFFGMFLAMIINKKTIKLKAFWRTCFVIVIAVPDFITLMMMGQFFAYQNSPVFTGAFNQILRQWFGLDVNVDWFGTSTYKPMNARVMVIVVNLWRGMPFTMLSTYGILMNIPEELYESSRIDGAGPVRRFVSITFPYIMFVMAPQLITTFTGNLNNFNVIYFLTGGGPGTTEAHVGIYPGSTDLLITWLFKLTIDSPQPEYNNGAVISLFMFIITSFFSLIVFNSSKSVTQEDTFK